MKRILTLFFIMLCAWCAVGGPLDSQLPISGPRGGGAKFPLTPPLVVTPTSVVFNASSPSFTQTLVATSPSSGAITYSSTNPSVCTVGTTSGVVSAGNSTGTVNILVNQSTVGSYFGPSQVAVPISVDTLRWNSTSTASYYDGHDDFASGPNPISGNSARTIMMWTYYPTVKNTYEFLFNFGDIYAGAFCLDTNGNETRLGPNLSIAKFRHQSWTRVASEWHHVAFTMPSGGTIGSISMYVDGNLNTNSVTYDTSPSEPINTQGVTMRLAQTGQNNYYAQIKLAEVAIFDRALSQSEIQSLYKLRLTGGESGLIRLYHCDEGTGTILYDACGSGKNLTLYNGATWTTKL